VLVLQGGGALGAYQAGVYAGMHEAGLEPDWVIGTSIGAINAAIIAGNPPERRVERLDAFWNGVEQDAATLFGLPYAVGAAHAPSNLATVASGIPGFFAPNPAAWAGPLAQVGVEQAALYSVAPLRATLETLVDFDRIRSRATRLTIGAVLVTRGELRYFDNRDDTLGVEHILASGALPPAFPAVRIDGEPYWDGGLYSNTPIEAVFDDRPRRDALIFNVQVWHAHGPEPGTLWDVLGRQKDIQYASRADGHIARQKQIHRLRHVIRGLARELPASKRATTAMRELAAYGCGTTMHVVRLDAPRFAGEDHTKDIDFTPSGIRARREAGLADARRAIAAAPWTAPVDPIEGVVIHDPLGAGVSDALPGTRPAAAPPRSARRKD